MKRTSTILWALTFILFISALVFAQNKQVTKSLIYKYEKGEKLSDRELESIIPFLENQKINIQNHPFNPKNVKATIMSEDFSGGALPTGWTNADALGTNIWQFNNPGGRTINTATNANGFAILDSDNYGGGPEQSSLITAPIDCSSNTTVKLEFEHYFKSGYSGTAEVSVSGDNGSTWTSLGSWSASSTANAQTETYDISAVAAGQSQVLIKWYWTGDYSWYWAVDDINVYEPSSTPQFDVSPASKDYGTVNLNESSAEQTFTVTNIGGGTLTISSAPTITGTNTGDFSITTDGNTYPVDLTNGQTATWGVTFSPQAEGARSANLTFVDNTKATQDVPLTGTGYNATLTPPFTEDFTTYLPTDWTEGQGTLAAPSTITGTTSSWTQDDYRNDTGDANGKSAKINIYGTSADEWLFTPPVDLGSGTTHYQLEFDLALTDWGNSNPPDPVAGSDDKFAVIISTDNGTTWSSANALQIWDNTTTPAFADIPNTGQHLTFDLTSYTGTVKFGFYGESTVSNGDMDLFVDNVQVREIPTTPIFSVTPSSKDYGTVFMGESSTEQTFTVSNTGQGTLTISSAPTITGTNTADFSITTDGNSYPVNLTNGQTATWGVTFTPQAEGARSANLTFVDNTKATQSVPLSGTGYNATVSTFPYTENFDAAAALPTDWQQGPSNTEDWKFGTSATYAASSDHTTGSGNIAWVDDSAPHTTDPISLLTPPFDITGLTTPTVSFYYWIGRGNGRASTLHVDVYDGTTWNNDVTTALTENGQWDKVTIDITSYKSNHTRVRFRGIEDPTNYDSDISIDDFRIGEPVPLSLNSVTVTQASTANALLGSTNKEILMLNFNVDGDVGTLPLNSIIVTPTNTSNADVAASGVKLYRTSTSTFATDNLVATQSIGATVTFSSIAYNLPAGNTYFWVTYDVASNGTVGNTLDAKIAANGIDVNGSTYNATDDDPVGARTISGLAFTGSNIIQASTQDISVGVSDNEILRIDLTVSESTTSGAASIDFTALNVTTTNTNDADVTNVKLYRTSTTTFATDNLIGTSAISKNTKGNATFSMSENLANGTTYYWITYDIPTTATDGNTVDAKIPVNGMTIGGSTYNATEDDPTGSRTLRQYNSGGNGTDYGGYYWSNSTSNSQNGNPPTYSWIDPVANGHTLIDNATGWTDDQPGGDDSYFDATIPFAFNFFGTSYTHAYINSNGAIEFTQPSSGVTGSSLSIPSATDPDNFIAGCMMDLDNNPTGFTTEGAVYYGTTGGEFVVTWLNYYDYNDATEWITFQIILKPSGNIKIQYNQAASTLEAGNASTTINGDALIGIENVDGSVGLQYRNNGLGGPIFDPAKVSNMAIEFGQSESNLPVELSTFTADISDRDVSLNWQTETEVDAYSFQVERALLGGEEFEMLGEVMAAGNSNSPKQYSFIDEKVNSGKYQYRLKMIDTDGSFEYSDVVEVEVELPMKYSLNQNYPNPFNPSTKIEYSIPETAEVKIVLYNIMGEVVAELVNGKQDAGFYTLDVDMAQFQNGLASGIYLYRMIAVNKSTGNTFVNVKKMILLK